MHCLNNLAHTRIPHDIIKLYLDIYPFVGRNQEMLKTVDKDQDVLIAQTVRLDAYFFACLLNLNIREERMRQLLTKDVKPKTKEERLLSNIKRTFAKAHDATEQFELFATEIHDMLHYIYKDVDMPSHLQFAKTEKRKKNATDLLSTTHATKREALDALLKSCKEILYKDNYETSLVIVNFYIDFINLKPFVRHNHTIGLVLLYILLLREQFASLHLASFFEMIHKQTAKFDKLQKDASHNWNEGLADIMGLHRFILELLLESYKGLHELLRNYTFDQQTNKSDYIENTINKLEDVFSKADIREKHPTISDSTINRTLKRLREEKKIRPLGTGRSAKWMKLYKSNHKKTLYEQIKLKV